MAQDTNVENLIINKLTRVQYESIETPDPTQLYFVTDEVISSADVENALGYTPYDASNPDGFISGITSSDVTTALGYTPYNSTNPNGYITSSALNGYATELWVTNKNYVNNTTLTNTLSSYALTSSLAEVATSGDYDDLINKPTIPSAVTESTVSGWGFTKNVGTVTSVNNIQPVNGNVTLTIPDISNLANKDLSNLSSTGNSKFQVPLESGTNIKTINGNSILGSGNLTLDGLPDQTGYNDAVLLTDGTDASWNEIEEFYPVIETYVNGTSGYRIYSDGYCEQWGYISSTGNGTVYSLLKTMKDTNYIINITAIASSWTGGLNSVYGLTTSSFKVWTSDDSSFNSCPLKWEVKGYIEV